MFLFHASAQRGNRENDETLFKTGKQYKENSVNETGN
jgi:hypothetical protein